MAVAAEVSVAIVLQSPSGFSPEEGELFVHVNQVEGGTYAYHDRHPFSLSGSEQTVDLGPITNVRLLYASAVSPVTLKLTHADGTDQTLPVEGVLAWQSASKPITGIKLTGTGSGVLAFAGD